MANCKYERRKKQHLFVGVVMQRASEKETHKSFHPLEIENVLEMG